MAASPEKTKSRHSVNHISYLVQSAASNLHFLINPHNTPSFPSRTSSPPLLLSPLLFSESTPHPPLLSPSTPVESTESDSSRSIPSSSMKGIPSKSSSGFPATVRISGLNAGKGGPAFVGHVFSMCDLSGTGLMSVSTHFDIPFLSKRTPEWLKKMFAAVTKSERNGPVFRFFMDLGDAVSYVKRLNIPSGVVGACRLDLAYEHFKEKPHLFQFIPNEKQVKEANKLLNTIPQNARRKHVDGVPVFSAQNLDIAIATKDGIKWYTPYFFDKSMLDSILEDSVDQHFHSLIHTRHLQRRLDDFDDDSTAEVVEEMGDSMWDPPEVMEAMDEVGFPEIALSVMSKVAENQLLDAVDKLLLGNRWLRKATGIQPKFPYMVDSFERRSIASLQRACKSSNIDAISESDTRLKCFTSSADETDYLPDKQRLDLRLPFSNWLSLPWLNRQPRELKRNEQYPSAFLPKITMVGVSMGEAGQVNKATLKKTMEDLTKELERSDHRSLAEKINDILNCEARDPLFVANVGDYHRNGAKAGSSRWVRSGGTV